MAGPSMNNLERLDAAIVEAAEAFIDEAPIHRDVAAPSVVRILDAVQAKREAQRPRLRCDFWINGAVGTCDRPAVQRIDGPSFNCCRCAVHGITVAEL